MEPLGRTEPERTAGSSPLSTVKPVALKGPDGRDWSVRPSSLHTLGTAGAKKHGC